MQRSRATATSLKSWNDKSSFVSDECFPKNRAFLRSPKCFRKYRICLKSSNTSEWHRIF